MKKKTQQALNDHINKEIYSWYLYLSMANYFEDENFPGMAKWMQLQAQEEMGHAMKFIHYVNDRDGRVLLKALQEPQTEWDSPVQAFEAAYEHECHISECIHKLVDLAREDKDHPTEHFLQWFVGEQVEEEATALTIVDKLRKVGDNSAAHLMLDAQLGGRGPAADS